MKAAFLDGNRSIHLEEREIPSPGEDEVVVKIALSSLCGTDIDVYSAAWSKGHPSGHEFTGTIHQVGTNVKRFALGDRVVAPWGVGCGQCSYCAAERMNLCDHLAIFHGAHAEYIRIAKADIALAHLPDSISWEAGIVMACALSTGFCGVEVSRVLPTETVTILGLGAVGLCMVLSVATGARKIIGADSVPFRCRKALELGAAETGNPLDKAWIHSHEAAADVVLVATANPAAMETAAFLARKSGRITVIGSQTSATLPFERMAGFGLHLHATWSMLGSRYMEKIVDLVSSGIIQARRLESLVTHRLPLSEIHRAFELFRDYDQGPLKIVIRP